MKKVTCIICPRGCRMEVDENMSVKGNSCKRGESYAIDECTDPKRSVTSVLKVRNRDDIMVSVKTSCPVKKGDVFAVMDIIRAASVEAPVSIGEVLIKDVYGADVIATKEIL